jgi:hypothetical protein
MAWLKAGETIELRERKRVIGHIIPVIPWPLLDEDVVPKAEGKRQHAKRSGPTAA